MPIDARHAICRSLSAKRIVRGRITHPDAASWHSDFYQMKGVGGIRLGGGRDPLG
jgi:hypothetical protein